MTLQTRSHDVHDAFRYLLPHDNVQCQTPLKYSTSLNSDRNVSVTHAYAISHAAADGDRGKLRAPHA